jgi:porin
VGERSSITAGKFNPIDFVADDPFRGGWGVHRFMNLVLVAPPSGLIPPVFMGAVASIGTERATWNIIVFDPNDRTSDYFPGDLFSDGVNTLIIVIIPGAIDGRKSSYTVTAGYSTADSVDYSTIPPGLETSNKSGAYNLAFQFTHNLQESPHEADASWGLYFKAATADGNPNYVKASIIAGIGGRALFFGRPQDSFGLGAFYYDLSDDLQDSLDPLAEFGDESGIEAYYSWAVTPWLHLSGDIQFVDPARRGVDSSVVAAVRANIRFFCTPSNIDRPNTGKITRRNKGFFAYKSA